MLKFLVGVVLVQLVTIALFFAVTRVGLDNTQFMLTIGLLEILFSVLAAFWFSSIARHRHMDELETIKEAHAREREKIRVNAERQKSRIVSKSQQQILKETRRAHAGANFKVGAAFAGALALGAVMLYSQFVTFGLLILTTAGGGLAGYLAKGRQVFLARRKELADHQQVMLPRDKSIKKLK
jgi:Flp pilus assembly protein TadB